MVIVPATAQAAFPGENGKIAYENFGRLYAVDPAVTGSQGPLTNPTTNGTVPAWSPNGQKLAFAKTESVTPDGCQIALTGIYAMNADGSATVPVASSTPYVSYGQPSWSPDGGRIAATRNFFGCEYDDFEEVWVPTASSNVVVMNADGTGATNVTADGCSSDPSWSPRGDKIAYNSCGAISVMSPDGNGKTALAPSEDDLQPDWSPDASRIVFNRGTRIYVMDADGTDVSQITSGSSVQHSSPAWSPDGTRIAFVQFDLTDFSQSLRTMKPDGSDPAVLVTSPNGDNDTIAYPSWQPIIRGYPRPKGASPMRIALVPAAQACTAPNNTHGAPLAFPSCSPVTPSSSNLAVSFGELKTKSTGAVKLSVNPGTNANPDDADVNVSLAITNVMNAADGSDYTGELRLELSLRITDKANTPNPPGGGGYGTVSDTSIFATAPCTGTAETTIGSTCSLTTTIDTVLPSTVHEGLRAIWALGQVKVHDGGADGDADTAADNTLFATQGLFVP